MFKRANKITSLLVGAATIISLVPAYASDIKKIQSEDGTVYNAIAYKDGKFYIDGEINDKDEATYYISNGKYKNLSDIDTGSDIEAYGTKYVDVDDGDYFVDLSTGKVTDDNIADDARDDAASALRKKVKGDTDGRYLKDGSANAADTFQTFDETDELPGSKFGDIWYVASYANKDATNGKTPNGGGLLTVYTDNDGTYIDADYNLGKIRVTTTGSGATKSEYIENTDDTYDTAVSSNTLTATVTPATTPSAAGVSGVIGQDKDYIYRKATVIVTTTTGSGATISEIDGQPVTISGKITPFTAVTNGYKFDVIQKISKAQSSKDIGGIKYAKTVTTYIIADSDGYNETFSYGYYTIANGKIIGYNRNSDNVDVQTATLKAQNGFYYVDLASASTGDDVEAYDTKLAVDIDSDGNLWRINGGYIYKWDNDEDWDKVYKVDGSFDEFSVYDKDNIVAWNEDDEVYSLIGNKKADDTATQTIQIPPVVSIGWVQAADGTWAYNKADGTKAIGWIQDGFNWYYTNLSGTMQFGWQNIGGIWYYLNPISDGTKGAMKTGWINDNGTWYYCNASGAMLANTTVNGYVLGASGAWIR